MVRIDESLLPGPRPGLDPHPERRRTGGGDQTASRLAIPILQRTEVNRLLGELLLGAAPIPGLRVPPPAACRRAVTRSLVRTALVIAVIALPCGC